MSIRVHPLPKDSGEPVKPTTLRGEACLGGDNAGGAYVGTSGDGTTVQWNQRSEFDLLLEFLDTDGNGKVSALELADFVDSLLGTQDHKRPNGSAVFEAVLLAALRHSSDQQEDATGPRPGQRPPPPPPMPPPSGEVRGDSGRWTSSSTEPPGGQAGPGGGDKAFVPSGSLDGAASMKELQQYGSQRYLSMEAVQACFAGILEDTALWLRLAGSISTMTAALFRQLLLYAGGRLEKRFSLGMFLRTYAAFNALPVWILFPRLWRTRGHGLLLSVYLHQLAKLHQQLGPWLCSRLPMHATLVGLTMAQFTASYVPLVAYFAAHGVPAMWQSHSVVEYMHANPMAQQLSLFSSILPIAILQFLTSSAALKLSCRDFVSLKDQCKAVFLLGDVSSQFEGYPGLTVRAVMDSIKARVEDTMRRSSYRRLNAAMPFLFGIYLETYRRLVRLLLVGNIAAAEPLAKVVAPFEVYAMFYNIWFAYSESADCTAYLFQLKKVSSVFKALLSKEEALSQSLPWLNNHSPRNLLLWARLRRYYQSPNCLELRWIEMHLTLVVLAALAVTIILIVTFVQKTLLRFTPENADLQMFVVWVIPPFIYLILAVVIDVIMSASTGVEYHDGIMTLSAEAVIICDRLDSADEINRQEAEEREAVKPAAAAAGGVGAGSLVLASPSSPGRGPSESGCGLRLRRAAGSEAGGSEAEVAADGGGRWRPAEQFRLRRGEASRLRQCQEVIRSLVSYMQFNAEYITLFGVPIDTQLRNTLFSVSVTLIGAGISAFLAIIIGK